MSDLRTKVIHLAYHRPDLRKHLVPLIKQGSDPVAKYREVLLDHGVEHRDLDDYMPLNMPFSSLNDHLREEALFFQFDGRPMSWKDVTLLSFEEVDEDPFEGTVWWEASILLPWESVARLMLYNTAPDKYFSLISELAGDRRFKQVVSENVDIDHDDWGWTPIITFLEQEHYLESEFVDERTGPISLENVVVERRGKFDSRGLQINFKGKSFVE